MANVLVEEQSLKNIANNIRELSEGSGYLVALENAEATFKPADMAGAVCDVYDTGYFDGESSGWNDGWNEGYDFGYEDGIAEGGGDDELWKGYFDKTLTSFVVPDGVTSIKDYAFLEFEDLESVALPDTITSIGREAFYCSGLSSINFPYGLRTIGSSCFEETSLESVELPDTVTSLGSDAFGYLLGLKHLKLSNSLKTIGSGCFYEAGIESLIVPASVVTIDSGAFYYTDLIKAVFKGTPEYIASDVFEDCEDLTVIEVPWSEGDPINKYAPWGAKNADIVYECEV